jgi:hypothetical protein
MIEGISRMSFLVAPRVLAVALDMLPDDPSFDESDVCGKVWPLQVNRKRRQMKPRMNRAGLIGAELIVERRPARMPIPAEVCGSIEVVPPLRQRLVASLTDVDQRRFEWINLRRRGVIEVPEQVKSRTVTVFDTGPFVPMDPRLELRHLHRD